VTAPDTGHSGTLGELVRQDDASWFKRFPDPPQRFREAIPGEFRALTGKHVECDCGEPVWVVVVRDRGEGLGTPRVPIFQHDIELMACHPALRVLQDGEPTDA